ncbi:hypothetical protein GA0070624_2879 [Micromonospora rhizosphaerae]|uniref:Uncharacterized protein n=1 Tax=Micromonospora rhizosphaerae TaxID=568872 RepID=A0A1C6S4L6_9ACTN|nr:hypothetical protein [Micromonospora rhizosphaerae]SCL24215.1 hypothetical protein GA0070624_2879 [Micromonospora rhizosphaerae]
MVSVTRRTASVIACAAFAALLFGAAPALAGPLPVAEPAPTAQPPADVIFVEVTPSTVEAGFLVGIRASCRENSVPAIVVSDAFGRIQVQPQRGLLTASPMVKERALPGSYRVKLECPGGQSASTMLQVVRGVQRSRGPASDPGPGPATAPSRGPATGFGGTAGFNLGNLLVPLGLALTLAGVIVGLVALRRPRTVRGAARR